MASELSQGFMSAVERATRVGRVRVRGEGWEKKGTAGGGERGGAVNKNKKEKKAVQQSKRQQLETVRGLKHVSFTGRDFSFYCFVFFIVCNQ